MNARATALVPATSSARERHLPPLIAGAGDRAALRFLEFFTVNIRNKNTRAAYARAAAVFLRWCEGQGIGELGRVKPVHVAAYIELPQGRRSAPTVKQHLACIRMLFDWFVIGPVMPTTASFGDEGRYARASVRGNNRAADRHGCFNRRGLARPGHYSGDDVHLRARRCRRCAHRRGYFSQKKRWWFRLHEKNGKLNEMPCHHKLEEYLDAFIKAAGIADNRTGTLFRSALGKTAQLSARPVLRGDVWRMVRRRAADAGIETAIGCHTFRATGITDYRRIEVAQRMAGHSNAKTTGLYDRRNDDVSVGEVERIGT